MNLQEKYNDIDKLILRLEENQSLIKIKGTLLDSIENRIKELTSKRLYNKLNDSKKNDLSVEDYKYLIDDKNMNIKLNISKNLNIPTETLIDLINNIDDEIVQLEIFRNLIKRDDSGYKIKPSIREELSKNLNLNSLELEILSGTTHQDVLKNVMKHPNVSNDTLDSLAKCYEEREDYLILIIDNKNTSKDTLEDVANNDNTPSKVLEILSTSKDVDVLFAVKNNLNTPYEIVEKLFKNESSSSSKLDALMDEEFIPKDESKSSNKHKHK